MNFGLWILKKFNGNWKRQIRFEKIKGNEIDLFLVLKSYWWSIYIKEFWFVTLFISKKSSNLHCYNTFDQIFFRFIHLFSNNRALFSHAVLSKYDCFLKCASRMQLYVSKSLIYEQCCYFSLFFLIALLSDTCIEN